MKLWVTIALAVAAFIEFVGFVIDGATLDFLLALFWADWARRSVPKADWWVDTKERGKVVEDPCDPVLYAPLVYTEFTWHRLENRFNFPRGGPW